MDPAKEPDIDALIENVLTQERVEHVPFNFHRKIGKCVRIAALRQREQARFRVTILLVTLGMFILAGAGVGLLLLTHGNSMRNNGLPGAFGFIDQYTTSFSLYLAGIDTASLLLLAVIVTLFSFVLGFFALARTPRRQG